ncbi:MAG: amidohydrolase family protein [Fidelibacterota bacterium]|nr:MAG: amidohydrolase family protein [Candidatus Neomarinimicrobiota bacterium]
MIHEASIRRSTVHSTLITFLLLQFWSLQGQVRPVDGLHEYKPRVYALTGATIHLEPGKQIPRGTVVIRDGLIAAAGRDAEVPQDAQVIPLEGKVIYPGFIESYWEIDFPEDGDQTKGGGGSSITRHWNNRVHPSRSVLGGVRPDDDELADLRKSGFTMAHAVPGKGIFRGRSAVMHLSEWGAEAPVREDLTQTVAFEIRQGYASADYPRGLLGTVALIRQTLLDAQWYQKAWSIHGRYPQYNEQPELNDDLDALAKTLAANQPFLFPTGNELGSLRAGSIAAEFGVPLWIAGNGYEYKRLAEIRQLGAFLILPVNFPEMPKVATLEDELQVSTRALRHWDQAPDNPRRLSEAGIEFALTSGKLKDKGQFKENLARAVERGFDRDQALMALTTIPAERLGLGTSHGKIAEGYVANLVVADGDYFKRDSKVVSVWVAGEQYELKPEPVEDFRGTWTLNLLVDGSTVRHVLEISGKPGALKGLLKAADEDVRLGELRLEGAYVGWTLPADKIGEEGIWRFSGVVLENKASGTGLRDDGSRFAWTAERTKPAAEEEGIKSAVAEQASTLIPLYPEGAYGRPELPGQPAAVLVRNATIWTSGPEGVIQGGDLLIEGGKVSAVGRGLNVPRKSRKDLVEIDGTGKHVTPGVIDEHSHTALLSVNEGTQAITAEVRIQDVIDPDDIAIYRQLAGGVTMANLLHGSSNPIGGQCSLIKLRWGMTSDKMLETRGPGEVKFALGENVKRSNWDDPSQRYPQTRMGVDQIIRDAFSAARDYQREWETYEASKTLKTTRIPPRRDLELDALREVLEGTRRVHCHSYRQDEVLNMIRIAEEFGFTIGTFEHILEGYKVATEIARHGAGASAFADWWSYKLEAFDAIPHAAALMTEVGVLVALNSDSDELARRLNTEAAKGVRYGGMTEEEALKMVTINPARQMKVEKYVGSLEPGKDGDFAIWSGPPLSTMSRCEQTWIDGRKYFDREEDLILRGQQDGERAELVQKALKDNDAGSPEGKGGQQ